MPAKPPALTIYRLGDEAPVCLAAAELARCLRKMTGQRIEVRAAKRFDAGQSAIYLGLPERFAGEAGTLPQPDRWDDAYVMRSCAHALVISGANERSVLFAIYHWLQELGARWVRPGKDGEYLPHIPLPSLQGWEIVEQAGTRHRGFVIEGYADIDEVLDLIAWMPKMRMNSYMLQFRIAANFWRRWYAGDIYNWWVPPHPVQLSDEECAALDERVIAHLQARGMIFHRVGHGWTAGAVGVDENCSGIVECPAEDIRPLLAQVKGVREWFGGSPTNTELCYSNPEAFRRIVEGVLTYAAAHPEVDVLHFWGSDNCNNWCDCAQCAPLQPSDWYIKVVNAIAPRLREINPRMRLIIICYTDTMWPPEQVQLVEPHDNVTFQFAPYDRCYAHAICDPACSSETPVPRFRRNEVVWPTANTDFANMLKAWQEYLPAGTDAVAFEYYYWWPLVYDLLAADFSRVIRDDVDQYRRHGVNGVISCQSHRAFLPTGLPMTVFGAALWNPDITLGAVEEQYYPAAFGLAADMARQFITDFKQATGALKQGNQWWIGLKKSQTTATLAVLQEYAPRMKQALSEASHPVQRRSLKLLNYYLRFQLLLWQGLNAHLDGRDAACKASLQRAVAYLWHIFPRVQNAMEVPYWVLAIEGWILPAYEEEEKERKVTLVF